MVFGTLEQRKFLVGTITKWFLFLFCMTFYPAMSFGLKTFAIEMGTFISGASTKEITQEFGEYLETLEKTLKAEADELNTVVNNLQAERNNQSSFKKIVDSDRSIYAKGVRYIINGDTRSLVEKLASAQKEKQEVDEIIASIDTDNPKGVARTINSLKSVLIIDDTDVTRKYKLDLSMKDSNGNDTGFLSPNAMLRMSVLAAQIMWQNVWEYDFMKQWETNAKGGITDKKTIGDFPLSRIFDLILCFLCEILEVVITCIEMIQYTMCICEFIICITFGIVIIPCLLFDGLKDMAMKLLPSLLAQTVKLAMITICMFFCCYTYLTITKTIIADTSAFNIWTFCYVVFTILLTFALCSNAPKLASALLTGQPQMSMGEFVQTASVIAGGTMAVTRAARTGVGAGSRFLANRGGDLAAMAGGAYGGSYRAEKEGKSKVAGGIGGAFSAIGSRTGNRIASGLQNMANYKGKKGGLGGGTGGVGDNRFNFVEHGNKVIENGSSSNHNMAYSGHLDENGKQTSVWGYMADTFKDYAKVPEKKKKPEENNIASTHPDSPGNNPSSSVGNNFNPPDIGGGGGAMPPAFMGQRSPIFNKGSSVSYRPQIEDKSDNWLAGLKSAGESSV